MLFNKIPFIDALIGRAAHISRQRAPMLQINGSKPAWDWLVTAGADPYLSTSPTVLPRLFENRC
jgi:hypothetical protein